jgi:hypothetical protein
MFKTETSNSTGSIAIMTGIDFMLIFFYLKQGFSRRPLRLCGE